MPKRDKREQAIRCNPKQVRYDDLDTLLQGEEFVPSTTSGSHINYRHPRYPTVVTIAAHGAFVPPYQVRMPLPPQMRCVASRGKA